MTLVNIFPDPKSVTGMALIVFGGWLALEGALMLSVPQLAIAAVFIFAGWHFRKRGAARTNVLSHAGGRNFRRWVRFCAAAIPILVVAYVMGYFALMDRSRPTSSAAMFTRFESSL